MTIFQKVRLPDFRPHLKSGPSENQTLLTTRNLDILVFHFVEIFFSLPCNVFLLFLQLGLCDGISTREKYNKMCNYVTLWAGVDLILVWEDHVSLKHFFEGLQCVQNWVQEETFAEIVEVGKFCGSGNKTTKIYFKFCIKYNFLMLTNFHMVIMYRQSLVKSPDI